MKILTALILAAALAAPAGAQTTFNRWQDMGQYVGQQTVKLNENTAKVAALESENAALKTKVDTLTSDMGLVINRYDMLLRAIVIHVCATNKLMADNAWAAKLTGMTPIPLPGHECPEDPLTAKYYVPIYLSPIGPPIPPP
jgi:hypothetical protein